MYFYTMFKTLTNFVGDGVKISKGVDGIFSSQDSVGDKRAVDRRLVRTKFLQILTFPHASEALVGVEVKQAEGLLNLKVKVALATATFACSLNR